MNALFFVALACLTAPANSLPQELTFLEPLAADQKKLVDAVREFDKAQTTIAKLALKTASEDKNEANAKAKRDDAKKRLDNVRHAYEYTLEKYRNDARAQTYYGELLYDYYDEIPGALQAWQLATSLDPKFSPAFNDLAIHYCHTGQYKTGLDNYDKAIKLDPKNPDYLFNIAQCYLINFPDVQQIRGWDKKRIFKEAIKLSKKAATLSPNDFELAQDYAVNFFAAENFDVKPNWKTAATAWQHARTLTSSPDQTFYTWLNEARVWLLAHDNTKARACLEQALALHPDNQMAQDLMEKANQAPEKPEKNRVSPKK